jgi:hypothetical protein
MLLAAAGKPVSVMKNPENQELPVVFAAARPTPESR